MFIRTNVDQNVEIYGDKQSGRRGNPKCKNATAESGTHKRNLLEMFIEGACALLGE